MNNTSATQENPVRDLLARQLAVAWQLTAHHLDGLGVEECLWRPAACGLHVHRGPDGAWHAHWPEHEGYELGPSSIAWLTWHLGFWWAMALDHNFGARTLSRDAVPWPADAQALTAWISGLHARWADLLSRATADELASSSQVRWPFEGRSLADLFAWGNTELTKSAAEIGYARFLYAARSGP